MHKLTYKHNKHIIQGEQIIKVHTRMVIETNPEIKQMANISNMQLDVPLKNSLKNSLDKNF